MQNIREQLQEEEYYNGTGLVLKTNEEIIDIITEFGNGELEFQTIDITRLVVENQKAKDLITQFKLFKINHEAPNDNEGQYNQGYVKACCHVINKLTSIF